MDRGYVRLWRKIRDCEVLHERGKVYSKYEAWLDIIMNQANGIERDGIGRGEFQASYRYLARAWNWDVAKTYRFIHILLGSEMLEKVKHQMKQEVKHELEHLKVCNYEIYNPVRNTSDNTKRNAECNKSNKVLNKGKEGEIKDTARSDSKSESSEPFIVSLPLCNGTEHGVTATHLAELSKLYPGVNPEQELLSAKGWLIANPTRRKTPRGIARFIHGWLSRAQDRGGRNNSKQAEKPDWLYTNEESDGKQSG